MNESRESRGLYRTRKKRLCGVCGGIAEYFDLSTFWVRVGVVLLFFMTGFWPVGAAYIIAALIMKPSPLRPLENVEEREFYDSYMRSPKYAAEKLKRDFEKLERRIHRMEDAVVQRGYEWERKFNR